MNSTSPQPLQRRRNTARLLAKLNPRGIGLPTGAGRGSAPGAETALDIAAALGAIGWSGNGPRLAALALCLRWWPSVFEGPAMVVGYRELERTFDRRQPGGGTKKVTYTERRSIEAPTETAAFRFMAGLVGTRLARAVAKRQAVLGEANAAREARGSKLPPLTTLSTEAAAKILGPAFLARWSRAVINEYRHPNQCQVCRGYGERMKLSEDAAGVVKATITGCEECGGQGVVPWSVKRRGKAVGISEHTFRAALAPHHDGALALLRELEYRGARLLLRRLGVADER